MLNSFKPSSSSAVQLLLLLLLLMCAGEANLRTKEEESRIGEVQICPQLQDKRTGKEARAERERVEGDESPDK